MEMSQQVNFTLVIYNLLNVMKAPPKKPKTMAKAINVPNVFA